MVSTVLLAVVGCAVCVLVFSRRSGKRDGFEAPIVPALIPIPIFGHVIGMLLYRNQYYSKIAKRWNLPLVAISMFGGKVYVIGSPDLIYSVQRQPKSLSFWFFEAQFSIRFGELTTRAVEPVMQGLAPDSEHESFVIDALKATREAMSAQGGLSDMTRITNAVLEKDFNRQQEKGTQTLDLYQWIRHEVTIATTEAVYGPGNPYRDPEIEARFWDFANTTIMLALPKPLRLLLGRKALAGREKLIKALIKYHESGDYMQGSQLTKARYACNSVSIGFEDNLSRSECVNGLAILANSAPAAFWTTFHVFSDPAILEEVRRQVEKIITIEPATDSQPEKRIINTAEFKDAPILASVIQETLRYRAKGTGPRMAMEDVVISDEHQQYHIKKGSVLILAHNAIHTNKDVWGESAGRFVADRFVPGKKIPTNAFRGFGGGANMCPGKSFAVGEISALLAMLVMRFDITPVGGKWDEPGQDLSNMAMENPPPAKEVIVEMRPRAGSEKVTWAFAS